MSPDTFSGMGLQAGLLTDPGCRSDAGESFVG